jgi:hypothetical protein
MPLPPTSRLLPPTMRQLLPDAPIWAQGERIDAATAAAAATAASARRKAKVWTTAASARRKAKVWTCAECAKAHKERSAVRQKGGGYVCLERCGLVEGARSRKEKRPREAGE